MVKIFALITAILVGAMTGFAQNDSPVSDEQFFEQSIQPIFQMHCYSCHGPRRQESNYRLDVRSRALGEGDFGEPPIIPGDSQNSPLIAYVAHTDADVKMPPADESKPLLKSQVQSLKQWIDAGAHWPDELAGAETDMTTDHWSFQPIEDVMPPAVKPIEGFPFENGIDRFVAIRLADAGLTPSPRADKRTLIRRLYLTMHGLQPTPEQMRAFLDDTSPAAYEKRVEQVLASHHYGERWARHWLDVVRFGESTGYEVNRDRENAYYYRDYVIDALNNDKPYKDFVIEQLAGDSVGVDEATGFLVGGPNDIVKSPDINLTLMQREDELADYVNTTSTTFLGLTVGCARCHNHKFDPILQSDYYSLQAVFAGVEHGERPLRNLTPDALNLSLAELESKIAVQESVLQVLRAESRPDDAGSENLRPMVNAKLNVDEFEPAKARFVRFEVKKTNSTEPCIDELEIFSADNVNVALAESGGIATSSGNYQGDPKHTLEHVNDGKFGNNFSWISDTAGSGWIQIEFANEHEINRVVWARDREEACADRLAIDYAISVSDDGNEWTIVESSESRNPFLSDGKEADDAFLARLNPEKARAAKQALQSLKELREQETTLKQQIPIGYVGTFKSPSLIHRLYRGDPLAPREVVQPDTLQVMGTLGLDNKSPEQQRRLSLAKWIASEDNPLTARVIVNRVWHYHFGRGIVGTPSDFGLNGRQPSHPELLDWLASEFMKNDWSLKWLHRQILNSSTFRQSSVPRAEAILSDADCELLWRFPPRRLAAEAIRDCVLQLSGKLNSKSGGPGFLLFKVDHENVHHYFPLEKFEAEHFRRMIYMTKIRQEQDDVFGVFDCPDGGQTVPDRTRSTTALQALNLLNSQFMLEQAAFLSSRLSTSEDRVEHQIRLAFQLAFSREPEENELSDSIQFVAEHGLEAFCRAILNANEFLFVS